MPGLYKINGFISEKRPITSRKSTKIKMLGVLLSFEFCNVYNDQKSMTCKERDCRIFQYF